MTLVTCITVKDRHRAITVDALRLLLKGNRKYYPGMDNWLDKIKNNDVLGVTRDIHIAKSDGIIIGTSISKHTLEKDKICCLYIDTKFRGSRIAHRLVENVLVKCKRSPILTIPEPRLKLFSSLIDHFRMVRVNEVPDRYTSGVTELVYEVPLQKV